MKVEPFLLVSTLNIIIGQRLVRKLSQSKEKYTLTSEEQMSIRKTVDLDRVLSVLRDEKIVAKDAGWDTIPFYRPKPINEKEDGFSGRVGIHEILRVSSTIKDMIIKGTTPKDMEEQAKKEGMMTMIEDGIFKAAQGITTIEEVLRVVNNE